MWKNHRRPLGQTNLGVPQSIVVCRWSKKPVGSRPVGIYPRLVGLESKSNTQIVPCGTDVLTNVSSMAFDEKAWNGTFFFLARVV
jgi:hypothetical protein